MKLRLALAATALTLAACSSTPEINLGGGERGSRILPDGTWFHDVDIAMNNGRKISFDGVLKLAPEECVLAGLSPFGTTVFQVKENLKSGAVDVKIIPEDLRKYQPELDNVYKTLRILFFMKRDQKIPPGMTILEKTSEGFPSRFNVLHEGQTLEFALSRWDSHAVPLEMNVKGSFWTATIRTLRYER